MTELISTWSGRVDFELDFHLSIVRYLPLLLKRRLVGRHSWKRWFVHSVSLYASISIANTQGGKLGSRKSMDFFHKSAVIVAILSDIYIL